MAAHAYLAGDMVYAKPYAFASDAETESTCSGGSSSRSAASLGAAAPAAPAPPCHAAPGAVLRTYSRPAAAPAAPAAAAWTFARPLSYAEPCLGIFPGDVLCVRSNARNALSVGAVGGKCGHVLLLLSSPHIIHPASDEADELREVLPGKDVWPLLRARAMESTRSDRGLHQSDVFFHVSPRGEVVMVGELNDDHEWVPYASNKTDLWSAPPELRAGFRVDIMMQVVQDMKQYESDWSFATAVRALLRSADVSRRVDTVRVLKELQECWTQEPICTSIVIIFWQRYLFKLALVACDAYPATAILRWMPLKADRALPGELIDTMRRHGWSRYQQVQPPFPLGIPWL